LREVGRFCKFVKRNFRALFPGVKRRRPVTIEQYLQVSNASPAVKAAIKRADAKLVEMGVGFDTPIPKSLAKRWASRKLFVKVENNLYDSEQGRKDKAPRGIQAASAPFIARVGPAFVPIQNAVKASWGLNHAVCFTSGVSAVDIGSYLDVEGQVFENDVTSWDASICQQLCQLEVWLARRLGAPRTVIDLMNANVNVRGWTTHGLKYWGPGTRKSGDPYTSLFNSILNGLMHMYCIVRSGVSLDTALRSVRMCVQGDDNIMVYPRWMRPRFDLLLKLGFKADCIHRPSLATAEFCSCRFFRHAGGWVLGPKLGRVMCKVGHFVDLPLSLDRLAVLRGVALGFLAAASYVPGLCNLVQAILMLTAGVQAHFLSAWMRDYSMKFESVEMDDSSRLANLFMDYEYYGVDTREVTCPKAIGGGFGVLSLALFDRDTSGPKSIFRV